MTLFLHIGILSNTWGAYFGYTIINASNCHGFINKFANLKGLSWLSCKSSYTKVNHWKCNLKHKSKSHNIMNMNFNSIWTFINTQILYFEKRFLSFMGERDPWINTWLPGLWVSWSSWTWRTWNLLVSWRKVCILFLGIIFERRP